MNEEVKKRFEARSKIIREVRKFFDEEKFLEVETPALHEIPGGALARPFTTHHNALGVDLYLRIALELHLKRLLVGGLEKIYEMGTIFRNEGIDAAHNPEFTMLECYVAYWNEEDMMKLVERLMGKLVQVITHKSTLEFEGKKIIFKRKFKRISFKELLKRYALITDYDGESRDSLATRARQFGIDAEAHEPKDEIYKKICRPYVVEPTFVINHPIEISPLAKKWEKNPSEVRRFQLVVGGMEVMNGFAELNDPLDQRERFCEQEKIRSGGEEEAHRIDEDFIEALEYGMPPAAGLGIGMDRLVMLLTNTRNIREVVLFPTLRPK
jgi:lysyl-tRNA synthetase, class II